jgi:hypothetical protein
MGTKGISIDRLYYRNIPENYNTEKVTSGVKRLAKVLGPLDWALAQKLAKQLGCNDE